MYSPKFQKFIDIWLSDFAIDKTIDNKICVDKNSNPIPWYTYPAIEYLSQFDFSNKLVFEFGVGYSTLYWSNRAKNVTSIEDNPTWYKKWQEEFNAPNLTLKQRDEGEQYFNAISEDNKKYDVIIIDGKCRAECAQTAIKALNSGGFIILDDSDRANVSLEYQTAIKTLKLHDLIQIDFFGFCPMNNYTKTTSLFLSREFNPKPLHDIQPSNGIGNLWGLGRKKRKEFYNTNK